MCDAHLEIFLANSYNADIAHHSDSDEGRLCRIEGQLQALSDEHRSKGGTVLNGQWTATFPIVCSPNEDFGRPSKHSGSSGTYFQRTFQMNVAKNEYSRI